MTSVARSILYPRFRTEQFQSTKPTFPIRPSPGSTAELSEHECNAPHFTTLQKAERRLLTIDLAR